MVVAASGGRFANLVSVTSTIYEWKDWKNIARRRAVPFSGMYAGWPKGEGFLGMGKKDTQTAKE